MDERKTFKEWYEFNKNSLDPESRFHIRIISESEADEYLSKLCEIEGNIDYILELVGHLKVYRVRQWGGYDNSMIRVDVINEAGDA